MYYTLMRVHTIKRSALYNVLILDLWNNEYNTGFEVHLAITVKQTQSAFLIAKDYIACIYDISDWDKIFREIKECK